MSEARKNYAIKGLNVMACMFVSTYHDTIKTYGKYDMQKHNQLFLKTFKDFGYSGSRMDDLLPFFEMYSNTIDVGIPMRKLLTQKSEHVANSQMGFVDFVDDNIMQDVPLSKLDEYLAKNCTGDKLDVVMKPKGHILTQTPAEQSPSKKPWYKNVYIWIAIVLPIVLLLIGMLLWFVFKKRQSNMVNVGYKANVRATL